MWRQSQEVVVPELEPRPSHGRLDFPLCYEKLLWQGSRYILTAYWHVVLTWNTKQVVAAFR